jgi:hypothetical protein
MVAAQALSTQVEIVALNQPGAVLFVALAERDLLKLGCKVNFAVGSNGSQHPTYLPSLISDGLMVSSVGAGVGSSSCAGVGGLSCAGAS